MNNGSTELRPAPAFLIGFALLLWGWQNQLLPYAIPMAILLESARYIHWRWPVSDQEFNRLTDLSGIGFFITIIYIFNDSGVSGIYVILSILPFVLFLLVLVQVYSERGRIKLSSLFISLRRLEKRDALIKIREIDLTLPYLVICLLAASAGNRRTIWFFIACCAFFTVILWKFRPRRFRASTWGIMLCLSFAIAFTAQIGVRELQSAIERQFMGFFEHFMWRYRDPNRTTTAIGTLGRLKLSDRILVRIETEERLDAPLYLREATYNTYGYGVWSAGSTNFNLIDPDIGGGSWTLNPGDPRQEARISTYMVKETGVIPVPIGTSRISGESIIEINQNRYAAINMESREGWIAYNAGYQNRILSDSPPDNDDLYVSSTYREDFDRLAGELGLHGMQPAEIVRTVREFFGNNFSYAIDRRQRYPRGRYLYHFLYESRQGHCEFFATSTVLLLRAAGIPARYSVGYLTREYSPLEGQYVARSRHAHSWAMAWVDDRWRLVDTTPPAWLPLEENQSSILQPLLDLYSWLRYRYEMWQARDVLEESEETNPQLLWLLIPLLGILIWRLFLKERVRRSSPPDSLLQHGDWPGMDSGLYTIVDLLEKRGYRRRTGETMAEWLRRIDPVRRYPETEEVLNLHYRYRFDPSGLEQGRKAVLDRLAARLLKQLRTSRSH